MITIEKNTVDLAYFEVNGHGRLLGANKRFCRMFGFEESEITWHYITDLYRHAADWKKQAAAVDQSVFTVRMKNRKGRSFNCSLIREMVQKADGMVVYRNTVRRQGEDDNVKVAAPENSLAVVYLAKCAHCSTQIRVATAADARRRMLCDACAAAAYPEAFHVKEAQV